MGIGLEQWRAAIGLYNAGRSRSGALVHRHRTTLEGTLKFALELLIQLASADPVAALNFVKAIGIDVEQWRAVISSDAGESHSPTAHSSNCSSSPESPATVASHQRNLPATCTASLRTALMQLILLSGDVERNPGPAIDGERARVFHM